VKPQIKPKDTWLFISILFLIIFNIRKISVFYSSFFGAYFFLKERNKNLVLVACNRNDATPLVKSPPASTSTLYPNLKMSASLLLICILLCPLITLANSDTDYETFNNESNHTDESCIEGFSCVSNGTQQIELLGTNSPQNSISIEKELWDTQNPLCSNDLTCSSLPAECITCNFNYTCVYGKPLNVTCRAIHKCQVQKAGSLKFNNLLLP
jgi:hypothetical protein